MGDPTFADRLRALGPDGFRRFVRDVYAHRDGVVVDRHGSPVGSEARGDAARRLYVHHPADGSLPALDPSVDAVVVPTTAELTGTDCPPVVDARELFRVARYGLDADVGDAIFRRHFDAVPDPAEERAVSTGQGTTAGGTDSGPSDGRGPEQVTTGDDGSPESAAPAGAPDGRAWSILAVGVLLFLSGAVLGVWLGTVTAGVSDGTDAASAGVADGNRVATPTPTATEWETVTVSRIDAEPLSASAAAEFRDRYAAMEPTCERPPDLVVQLQVNALRYDDGSSATVATVYRFASPANRQKTRPLSNFAGIVRSDPFQELLDHERAEYGPLVVDGTTARQQVTVSDGDGDTETYLFRLSKQTDGEYAGCWMTDSVEPLIPGT